MIDVLIKLAVDGCYEAHKFIDARLDAIGAKGDVRDYLFCIDPLANHRIVLRTKHQTAAILGETRPLPTIISNHQYDFCIRVSPVRRCDPTGKRVPAADLLAWQEANLGDRCGVLVQKVYMRSYRTFCAKGKGFLIPDVVMVGRLKVVDPMKVMETLQAGIGRYRAFGFGLLQLFSVEK